MVRNQGLLFLIEFIRALQLISDRRVSRYYKSSAKSFPVKIVIVMCGFEEKYTLKPLISSDSGVKKTLTFLSVSG
jgi:hypothetical protein